MKLKRIPERSRLFGLVHRGRNNIYILEKEEKNV